MNSWEWEIFEGWVTNDSFTITDRGPLHGPITRFSVTRDDDLKLVLETISAEASTSSAIPVIAGTVSIPTAQVKFEGLGGSSVMANGVTPRSLNRTSSIADNVGESRETSSIHALEWDPHPENAPKYVIEWLENMSDPFIWPSSIDEKITGEKRRTLRSPKKEIVMTSSTDSGGMSRSCAHISCGGFDLFVGSLKNVKAGNINHPGFILYEGAPSEDIRSKIRDCLSFSLGMYLIYLGHTAFNEKWEPVSYRAVSAYALSKDDHRRIGEQPAPLGPKYLWEVTSDMLERMVSSLVSNYDSCNLGSVFWAYWHAVAAPIHMSAVHFGAAIESLQNAFVQDPARSVNKSILEEAQWKELSKKLDECITALEAPPDKKGILSNKVKILNNAPQGIVMDRFLDALGIRIGAVEKSAWQNRNKAAHGKSVNQDNAVQVIRETKALRVLMNRALLAIGRGSDSYYDYYTLGRPASDLEAPIPDDNSR